MRLDGHTIQAVRERVAPVLMLVDGGRPYDMIYDHSPGDVVEVVLEDRSVLVPLGQMGMWFGTHRCLDP